MYDNEDFLKLLKDRNPYDIIPLEEYKGMRKNILMKCNVCGCEWSAKPYNLTGNNPTGCPECGKKRRVEAQTMSHEEFVERAKEYDVTFLEEYKGALKRIRTRCNICGYVWDALPGSFIYRGKKYPCPKCSGNKHKTTEEIKEAVKDGNIEIVGEYTNALEPIRVRCKICGYEWDATASLVTNGKASCQACFGKRASKFQETFNIRFQKANPDFILLKNDSRNLLVKCRTCGYVQEVRNVLSASVIKCPYCCKNLSYGEMVISKFLKDSGISFERNYHFNDLKDEKYLTYDFYIPDRNLLIEYNGAQHYEPRRFGNMSLEEAERRLEKQKYHDRLKCEYAEKKNIRLLVFTKDNLDEVSALIS